MKTFYFSLLLVITSLFLAGCFDTEPRIFGVRESVWLTLNDDQRQEAIRGYNERNEPEIYGCKKSAWERMSDWEREETMREYRRQQEIEAREREIRHQREMIRDLTSSLERATRRNDSCSPCCF